MIHCNKFLFIILICICIECVRTHAYVCVRVYVCMYMYTQGIINDIQEKSISKSSMSDKEKSSDRS